MSKRLSVVSKDEGGALIEGSFAQAARDAIERALAMGAGVILIAFETPDTKMHVVSVPGPLSVMEGVTRRAYDMVFPDPPDPED